MLTKKLLYSLASLLLLATVVAYALFNGASGIHKEPAPFAFIVVLSTVPLILVLVTDRMHPASRLPKDISWLWLVFFGCWAFVCANIAVLASRQSTIQYGLIMTGLDLLGFDMSYGYNEVVKLEALAVQASAIIAAALLFFIPAYIYRNKQHGES